MTEHSFIRPNLFKVNSLEPNLLYCPQVQNGAVTRFQWLRLSLVDQKLLLMRTNVAFILQRFLIIILLLRC